MKNTYRQTLIEIWQISKPGLLILGFAQYHLGAGIANYLGANITGSRYWLGLVWVLLLQWLAHLMNDYFLIKHKTQIAHLKREEKRLLIGLVMALGFVVLIMLMLEQATLGLWLIAIALFLIVFFYRIAPLRLASSGFGELSLAVAFGSLVPAFAFLLQESYVHQMLLELAFPMILLGFALQIALQFEQFGKNTTQQPNLLFKVGWQNGMFLHNAMLLLTYVAFGLAGVFGVASAIILPAFLSLPLALLQIWHMRQISLGVKPNWRFITLNAFSILAYSTYILNYTLWTR